jgi:hypothetical protein
MEVNAEIALVKAELAELKSQVSTTASEAERIALRQQISATTNELAEWIKKLPDTGKSFFLISFSINLVIHSSVSMPWLHYLNQGLQQVYSN